MGCMEGGRMGGGCMDGALDWNVHGRRQEGAVQSNAAKPRHVLITS